jgi:hypothetical protein
MFSLIALAGLISATSGSVITTPGPSAGSTLTLDGVDCEFLFLLVNVSTPKPRRRADRLFDAI